jgi:hypothetical protein
MRGVELAELASVDPSDPRFFDNCIGSRR